MIVTYLKTFSRNLPSEREENQEQYTVEIRPKFLLDTSPKRYEYCSPTGETIGLWRLAFHRSNQYC
jgi:RNA polymerase-binding transcription factor DksA